MAESSTWTHLHAQLHNSLLHRQLLPRNQRILVAVSGGQDSLCLIKLLLDLQPKWSWNLAIAHCDHRWRADSKANADRVEELATIWQVPFYRQIAEEIPKTEAAARQWRYQALAEVAIAHNYSYIVTGHTASDRAETLLYNLIRGSGADGLCALTWHRPLMAGEGETGRRGDGKTGRREDGKTGRRGDGKTGRRGDGEKGSFNSPSLQIPQSPSLPASKSPSPPISQSPSPQIPQSPSPPVSQSPLLVRPLLDITRSQTGKFCQEQNLEIWEDSTNQDLRYARNRIRSELLPYLQTHFNPQAEQALAQTAELLRADADYLELAADELRLKASCPTPESQIRLNRRILQEAPLALQRRVLRQVLQEILPLAPNFAHIEKMRELIAAPNRSQTDPFPGGAIAIVEHPWIKISN